MSTDKRPRTKELVHNQNYNKKRQPLFRVEISTADTPSDVEKMMEMKDELILKSGTAKRGVIEMYEFAKKMDYFDKGVKAD
jgi:hypothetical protein